MECILSYCVIASQVICCLYVNFTAALCLRCCCCYCCRFFSFLFWYFQSCPVSRNKILEVCCAFMYYLKLKRTKLVSLSQLLKKNSHTHASIQHFCTYMQLMRFLLTRKSHTTLQEPEEICWHFNSSIRCILHNSQIAMVIIVPGAFNSGTHLRNDKWWRFEF